MLTRQEAIERGLRAKSGSAMNLLAKMVLEYETKQDLEPLYPPTLTVEDLELRPGLNLILKDSTDGPICVNAEVIQISRGGHAVQVALGRPVPEPGSEQIPMIHIDMGGSGEGGMMGMPQQDTRKVLWFKTEELLDLAIDWSEE